MKRLALSLVRNSEGAVAPTLALSLVALIAVGGVAFDYARVASMDTELQNAADQAALAAASQIDGSAGACSRAAAAARVMITNLTYMANDGATNAVVIADEPLCDAVGKVRFYQNITKTTPATSDENAKFVEIQVNSRTANYALTPVVAAFSSGPMSATAFAGLGEAICRMPPMMMCNPNELTDPDFTTANYVGKGIRLVANDGGGNYGYGLFGFLEVGQGPGTNELKAVIGRQGDPGDCAEGGGVEPNNGNVETVRDALNTRFDLLQNGLNQPCGANGDLCPPSQNSRKDLLRHGTNASACGFVSPNGNNGWKEVANAYPPSVLTSDRTLTEAEIDALAPMGYPRDICHAVSVTGTCAGGIIGDGDWDRYAYFRSHRGVNYVTEGASTAEMNTFLTNTFLTTQPTRYEIYKYEMANAASRLQAVTSGGLVSHGTPVCNGPGIQPGAAVPDRRVLTVAVMNCDAEDVTPSSTNVQVQKWVDIFLVEPAVPRSRTESHDIYVEVVGETQNSGNTLQVVQKAVPYLIE